jgi:cytidyltransferase-like protein
VIGLLGGAFDPPHIGHVALAAAAERELGLEGVVVIVVADPGHKDVHCPPETRLDLARAAFPGREVGLDRHARTVDMLREGSWAAPVFLVGADEFADFLRWKEPNGVLELARLGVGSRPGHPRERLDQVLASSGLTGSCSSSSSRSPFPRTTSGNESHVRNQSAISYRPPLPRRSRVVTSTAARLRTAD